MGLWVRLFRVFSFLLLLLHFLFAMYGSGTGHPTSKATDVLGRMVVDMIRDMMDVQFYTGEYASKKFEVARDLLPELYQGLARLKEQLDGKDLGGAADDAVDDSLEAKSRRRLGDAQQRAHRVLTRLATSMLRCVTKANGEMAYQLLYQQEAYLTYTGYQMFTRFLNYAVDHCRDAAVQKAKLDFPDYRVVTVQVGEESGTELVALDAVATIAATEPDPEEEEGEAAAEQKEDKMFVSHNQKDDYLHRGASAVLRHMSLLMYSRFVVRRPTERHKVDYYRYFPFSEHYVLSRSYIQAGKYLKMFKIMFCLCFFGCLLVFDDIMGQIDMFLRSVGRNFAWETTMWWSPCN